MDEKIFQISLASIPVFGAIITGFIIPFIHHTRQSAVGLPFIKEKIGAEKLAKYEYWTSMAVKCAEMMFKEQGMGEAKKEYVVNFLNEMFNKNKVVITSKQIEILVEAAVKELKLSENK